MNNIINRTPLAQNLIRLRKRHGLTQEDLAKLSGVSRRVIAFYESKSAKPPLHNIEKLAKALNVNIEELIEYKKNGQELTDDLSNIDSRTLKKLKQILSLTPEQRHMVYAFVDSLMNKNK
jgi:transcriptional regulator with XRE-family HTH domain